ncbi:hypothetical protein Q9K01_10420 [Qipengyuania sp. DY56-A-20]|jgi:hypothetical protein|uniref:Uncharacterized protein n=1 Tax=Qipengyuania benthica TaxID=3067651 RepID=A0ABT9HB25_9SPHN|nr:hypothetical protein [Qipengyuania sp. DY56-A-20]MBU1254495.1 hypothetical protein [Alphaproteobacteria bacterium]MDP4540040.1 hypothetical protein [Qipengyuania sp. DY56-A-20]
MYDRRFFATRLGRAALVSIGAMVIFVGFSSQIAVTEPLPTLAIHPQVELA